jgi:hypothetical protein
VKLGDLVELHARVGTGHSGSIGMVVNLISEMVIIKGCVDVMFHDGIHPVHRDNIRINHTEVEGGGHEAG